MKARVERNVAKILKIKTIKEILISQIKVKGMNKHQSKAHKPNIFQSQPRTHMSDN